MNEEKIDINKIVDELKDNNKKNKKSSYGILGIFLVFFVIMFIMYIGNKTTNYLYMSIICLVITLVEITVIVIKNRITNNKINEVLKYKDEIDKYCEYLGKDIYTTKNKLLLIKPDYSSIKQVYFNNIVNCVDGTAYKSSGENYVKYPTIVVTTNDNKKIVFESTDKLYNILSKYYDGQKKKTNGELISSSVIKDYIKFDDYQQGFIDLPLFNKNDCSLWIDSDVSVDYANKVALAIKALTEEDIDSAKESTIWYYNNELKESGYHPEITNMPLKLNKEDVLKYLSLEEIYIRKPKSNDAIFTLFFHTKMEGEHGFSWVFKEKQVIYVGAGSDYEEGYVSDKNNFAKIHHQEVKLTEEEYQKLEQNNS